MLSLILKEGPFILVGALIAAGLLVIVNLTVWLPQARNEGEARYIARQAVIEKKIELERKNDDLKIRGLSDYDVCITYVGKLPECDALRL